LKGIFFLDGRSSADLGLYISSGGILNSPEIDAEAISIPGKNGDLVISNNRYKNCPIQYPAFVDENALQRTDELKAWLLNKPGYRRLQDNFNPAFFRIARFIGPLDIESYVLKAAEFTIAFDCKPQRYLCDGEILVTMSAAGKIYNPTAFTALPLIRIYGTSSGTLTVGNTVVQIKSINEYVDLDCELQDAFKGITNCNSNVYAPNFPTLPPGGTGISFSGGITKIEIKPRWWIV